MDHGMVFLGFKIDFREASNTHSSPNTTELIHAGPQPVHINVTIIAFMLPIGKKIFQMLARS
jgi:hypothetical protein